MANIRLPYLEDAWHRFGDFVGPFSLVAEMIGEKDQFSRRKYSGAVHQRVRNGGNFSSKIFFALNVQKKLKDDNMNRMCVMQ